MIGFKQTALVTLLASGLSLPVMASIETPFYSFSMEGPGLYYANSSSSTFLRPDTNFSNFWSFCQTQPYYCNGYGQANVQQQRLVSDSVRFDEAGSVLAHEMNVSANGLANLTIYSFPSTNRNTDTGKYTYDFSTTDSLLAKIPKGKAEGEVIQENLDSGALYIRPGDLGSSTFKATGLFDARSIPLGYSSIAETEIIVSFYSSWINDKGRPDSFSKEVFRGTMVDTSNLSFILSNNLNDYPVGQTAAYGAYNITVVNQFSIAPSAVPAPAAAWLFGSGLIGLLSFNRRKDKTDNVIAA